MTDFVCTEKDTTLTCHHLLNQDSKHVIYISSSYPLANVNLIFTLLLVLFISTVFTHKMVAVFVRGLLLSR